ncbi:chromate efflux transporter [Roseomonas sp. WA12]
MSETTPGVPALPTGAPALPSFAEAFRVWLRIGLLSFGGPAGQIALLHREVVDERRWVSDARFLHALNFCTLLPGPEAQQLATYLGWLLHGVRGGVAAGVLFVLPGMAVMLALSILYATLGTVPLVAALFFGLQCAVLVLVLEALLRVARRALRTPAAWAVAAGALVALQAFAIPFPVVVLVAALIGAALPSAFRVGAHGSVQEGPPALLDAVLAADPGRPARQAAKAWRAGWVAVGLWLLPVVALLLLERGVFADIALFFSKMAVVTVGGAYAVLAYVAQQAVQGYGWLTPEQMLVGLGLAETTPGPLILVLQFVGFLAGYGQGGGLLGGVLASVLTVWVIFAPCFAFIFLGAPYVERLHAHRVLTSALAAVTAAVVGVIANLALWFGMRVLFAETWRASAGPLALDLPVPASLDPLALLLAAIAAACLFLFRIGLLWTLAVTAALGLVARLVPGMW